MERDPHETVRDTIAEYAAGRLDADTARQVDEHLADCAECRELAASAAVLAGGLEHGGSALLTPHPEPELLTGFALGEIEDADGSIDRHLAVCSPCSLEVDVWREQGVAPGFGLETRQQAKVLRFPTVQRWGLAAAAMLAGVLLGGFLLDALRSPEPWSGSVPMTVLERPLRSDAEPTTVTLMAGQPYALLGVALVLPDPADGGDRLRFDLHDADGERVWSHAASIDSLRPALEATGVATLLVPSDALAPGDYRLQVRPDRDAADPLLEIPIRLTR